MVGAKRSGKDSVGRILVDDYMADRHSFADNIRDILLEINPLIDDSNPSLRLPHNYRVSDVVDRFGWETAKQYPEVRRLLQELGTRMRRIDPNLWVTPVRRSILLSSNPLHVVTDVRFENEVAAVKEDGGFIVRVTRPGLVNNDSHPSEQLYRTIEPDYEIINDGSLEDLGLNVRVMLESAYARMVERLETDERQ